MTEQDRPNVAAAGIMTGIGELKSVMNRIATRMERPAPDQMRPTFTTHVRLRTTYVIFGGTNTTTVFELMAGSRNVLTFVALNQTQFVPFEITIDRGTDVTIRNAATGAVVVPSPAAADNLVEFLIFAYPE